MHKRSTAVMAFVLMIVLIGASLLWGAYRGWSTERKQVETSMGTLEDVLSARREVGANILTVARRHLPAGDPLLLSVQEALNGIAQTGSLSQRARANQTLQEGMDGLLAELRQLPSLMADERDSMYVNQLLPQAMEQSAHLTEQAEYNLQAERFNRDFTNSFSGRLARLLGVRPAEQFIPQEGDAP